MSPESLRPDDLDLTRDQVRDLWERGQPVDIVAPPESLRRWWCAVFNRFRDPKTCRAHGEAFGCGWREGESLAVREEYLRRKRRPESLRAGTSSPGGGG